MITAIIQARMGSTRFPGKVLKEILGKSILWHLISRIEKAKLITEIVIATTKNDIDQPFLKFAEENGIKSYAGSEEDVLDRYYQAAKKFSADPIVRITADCPLMDPEVIDSVVQFYLDNKYDYVANTLEPTTFPDGMDVEVFSFKNLEKIWKEAILPSQREHVTFYFWQNPGKFSVGRYDLPEDMSKYRLTLDYPEDLTLIRIIFRELYPQNNQFDLDDIIQFLRDNPKLLKINSHLKRNASWQRAFEKDKQRGRGK